MRGMLVLILLLGGCSGYSQCNNLLIEISNICRLTGKIRIGLYKRKEDFPEVDKEYRKIAVDVHENPVTCSIKCVPPGVYAIALYHDENTDGKCNRNLIGMPTERYGFSNNVHPVLSPPLFEQASFQVKADTCIRVSLID